MVDRLPMTNAAGQFLFMVQLEECEQRQDAIPKCFASKAVDTTFTKQICHQYPNCPKYPTSNSFATRLVDRTCRRVVVPLVQLEEGFKTLNAIIR